MVEALTDIAAKIEKPTALIVISAHWEDDVATVTHSSQLPIIHDYYGFPQEAYEIQYPAPGAPQLAEDIQQSLIANNVESRLDNERGFDHGLYVPLRLM